MLERHLGVHFRALLPLSSVLLSTPMPIAVPLTHRPTRRRHSHQEAHHPHPAAASWPHHSGRQVRRPRVVRTRVLVPDGEAVLATEAAQSSAALARRCDWTRFSSALGPAAAARQRHKRSPSARAAAAVVASRASSAPRRYRAVLPRRRARWRERRPPEPRRRYHSCPRLERPKQACAQPHPRPAGRAEPARRR